jgi:hypothetical protein
MWEQIMLLHGKMSVTFLLEQFILNEQSDVDLHLAVLVISGIGL